MERIVSCCGVVCSQCEYHPQACDGCPVIEGKVFWLQYTGGERCEIYDCCVRKRGLAHCGQCGELPCGRYDPDDPTKSAEENRRVFEAQMTQLRALREAERAQAKK